MVLIQSNEKVLFHYSYKFEASERRNRHWKHLIICRLREESGGGAKLLILAARLTVLSRKVPSKTIKTEQFIDVHCDQHVHHKFGTKN